jgi:hypothetical protein
MLRKSWNLWKESEELSWTHEVASGYEPEIVVSDIESAKISEILERIAAMRVSKWSENPHITHHPRNPAALSAIDNNS